LFDTFLSTSVKEISMKPTLSFQSTIAAVTLFLALCLQTFGTNPATAVDLLEIIKRGEEAAAEGPTREQAAQDIAALYRRFLNRDPDPRVLEEYVSLVQGGRRTMAQIEQSIRRQRERFSPPIPDVQTIVPRDTDPYRSDRPAVDTGLRETTARRGDLPDFTMIENALTDERKLKLRDDSRSFFIRSRRWPPKGTVVLLHGFTDGTWQFETTAAALAERGYNVYVPRLPGHGYVNDDGSPNPYYLPVPGQEHMYTEFADRVYREAAALGQPVYALGLPGGGAVALDMANRYPDLQGVIRRKGGSIGVAGLNGVILCEPFRLPPEKSLPRRQPFLTRLLNGFTFGLAGRLLARGPVVAKDESRSAMDNYSHLVAGRTGTSSVPMQIITSGRDQDAGGLPLVDRIFRSPGSEQQIGWFNLGENDDVPASIIDDRAGGDPDTREQVNSIIYDFLDRGMARSRTPRDTGGEDRVINTSGRFDDVQDPRLRQYLLDQNPAELDPYYRPIGRWAGRLILPQADQRLPNGAVPFLVTNSPDPELIGKTLILTWVSFSAESSWTTSFYTDVTISPGDIEKAEKRGARIPLALNGWKRVSVLESLAAARPHEMDVVLPEPVKRVGETLKIDAEPVQISGSHKALVRFDGPPMGHYRRVVHFNPATGSFDGPEEYVSIPPRYYRTYKDPVPMSCTESIEKSEANTTDGWYIFGSRKRSVFVVEALEPRRALLLEKDACVVGKEQIKTCLAEKQYTGLTPDLTRRAVWQPNEDESASANDLWSVGDKGMLLHLFGWRAAEAETKPTGVVLGQVTGHFSFGEATVVRCPFTGEKRWDIEYYQIYAHNANWIVSGTQKWHAYMGNLKRGWMYTLPVSDTIVKRPDEQAFMFAGQTFDLFRCLQRNFEMMMAVYRTGAGRGVSSVRTDISCVQDSHAALFAAFRFYHRLMIEHYRFTHRLSEGIKKLVEDIQRAITFHGIPSTKWQAFSHKPSGERRSNLFTVLFDSMLSAGTIFPRNGNDRMIEIMTRNDLPMWNVMVSQIAGHIPGVEPLAPTSPRRR